MSGFKIFGVCVFSSAAILAVAACGDRTIRIDLVPVSGQLTPQVIESADSPAFSTDKIAMISVSGLIANSRSDGLLSSHPNPVSEFRETLDAIAKDDSIKAVVLRINSPGGTVTASDMMYKDLLEFKKKTGKPVVACMMDVCASGGYYVSCAADYRIAYPTTITGSIGVIMETVNINGTLQKIGVATEAVKSGPNKDMGSPFKPTSGDLNHPLTDNDRDLLQKFVNEDYANFKAVVKASPQHISDADWPTYTDGRIVSGTDAAKIGLIDQTGDLEGAISKAKEMAHIKHAKIIMYTHADDSRNSIYASPQTPTPTQQVNMLNINLDLGELIPRGESQFLYLWTGFGNDSP